MQQQAKEKKRSTDVCIRLLWTLACKATSEKIGQSAAASLPNNNTKSSSNSLTKSYTIPYILKGIHIYIYISKASKANSKVPEKSNDLEHKCLGDR